MSRAETGTPDKAQGTNPQPSPSKATQDVDAPAITARHGRTVHGVRPTATCHHDPRGWDLKVVPATPELRTYLRGLCRQVATRIDRSEPLQKQALVSAARQLLAEQQQPQGFLGWTMVALSNAFWREQVAAVPHRKRLFLLPQRLPHAADCPAGGGPCDGTNTVCAACRIADFRTQAAAWGYQVLASEDFSRVMKILVTGTVDAIVGVASLDVLEKAIDKVLLAGVPAMAVPLLCSTCCPARVDAAGVQELLQLPHEAPHQSPPSYLHLLRSARQLFQPEPLHRLLLPLAKNSNAPEDLLPSRTLVPPVHTTPFTENPLAATAQIAYDFLAQGGKYARPFITLAAYDAMTGGHGVTPQGPQHLEQVSDAVRRVALSMETFHKASLVHDDIEDDDNFRYGEPALHRTYGLPVAVNVGDFMIGLGYRLVSQDLAALGPAVAGEILDRLAAAHVRLSQGQGAELVWRDASDKQLTPEDALDIYALKTAPAFAAALLCGIRCAAPLGPLETPLQEFAQCLGVAFQILNDLKDWEVDQDNKRAAGLDILGRRPTLLWALALQSLTPSGHRELRELVAAPRTDLPSAARPCLDRVEQLYREAGVFAKANQLVATYQQRAARIADAVEPAPLSRLLHYLVNTVLDQPAQAAG